MQYGICHLSIIPVRSTPDQISEMVTQLLFGEHYKVLESRKNWSKIKTIYDKCEGWIMNNQLTFISEDEFNTIQAVEEYQYVAELISFVNRTFFIFLNSFFSPVGSK